MDKQVMRFTDPDEEFLRGNNAGPVVKGANRTTTIKNASMQVHKNPEVQKTAALTSGSSTEVTLSDKISLVEYVQNPYTDSLLQRFETALRQNHTVKGALGVRRHFIFSKGSELIIELNEDEMSLLSSEEANEKQEKLKQQNVELLTQLETRDKRLKLITRLKFLQMQRWGFGRGALVKLYDEQNNIVKLHPVNSRRLGDPVINTDDYYNISGVMVDGQGLKIESMLYAPYNDDELSPHTTGFGYSELEAIIDEAETLDILLDEDMKEIAKASWLSSVILKIQTMGLSNAQATARITTIVNAVAKAGKIIGTNEEVDAMPIDLKPDFNGLIGAVDKLEAIVYKTLQVPQFMVQSESAANRATAVQSATQFLNGPVADDQEDISIMLTENWYDPYLLENKELLRDENGTTIPVDDRLPFHVKRVFNQAKASEFVDLANSVVALKNAGVWDVRKANEVLGSEEVTPRIEAALKEQQAKMEQQMQMKSKEDEQNDAEDKEIKNLSSVASLAVKNKKLELKSKIADIVDQISSSNSLKKKHISTAAEDEDITWITVNGNHIPIHEGETKEEAVEKFLAKKSKSPSKSKQSEPTKIKQPKLSGEVQGTVNVDGHEVEYDDNGPEEAISNFRDANGLWKTETVDEGELFSSGKPGTITAKGEQIEEGLKEWGSTDRPSGSVYLTRDGTWAGGESVNGFDEDHRPQISKAMTIAGIKINNKEGKELAYTERMQAAMRSSGTIRARVSNDNNFINLDLPGPPSTNQVNAVKDQMINMGISIQDVEIDTWGKGDTQKSQLEQRMKRLFDPDY